MKALEMAWETRGKPVGVMFQAIKAVIIMSRQFRQLLWRYRIRQSMSRRETAGITAHGALLQESEERMGASDGLCKASAMQLTQ